jgi:signal transduction histidine kinase
MHLSHESLAFLADRSLATVRAHPDAHGVRLIVEPMPQTEVWMDALKIERALFNLLLNSCQAARQGNGLPEIGISLTESQEEWSFRIADNGPGVPDSVRVTLFQPFVSVGKPSGMGLGLTLAHKIALEHGGNVTLEESHPGRTVFRLSLSKSTLMSFGETPHATSAPLARD